MIPLLQGLTFGIGAFAFIALPYLCHWGGVSLD